jgi:hypothetical protein
MTINLSALTRVFRPEIVAQALRRLVPAPRPRPLRRTRNG